MNPANQKNRNNNVDGQTYNPYETAQAQFDRIADELELSQPERDLLRVPIREYHFSIPVRMDDGDVKVFRAFRIQHNDVRVLLAQLYQGFTVHITRV